jgi:hypothetical protein
LLAEFGVQTFKKNKVFLLQKLRKYFAAEKAAGRQVVILVDEAQNLSVKALEELRMLSSMELELAGLVSVVLVGQPELNELLDSPQLEQLRQRVRLRQHLMPLIRDEVHAYIDKRLEVAGSAADTLFSSEAVDRIFIYTEGVPRLINTLCEAALTSSWAEDEERVSGERIDDVASDLGWRRSKAVIKPVAPVAAANDPVVENSDTANSDELRTVYGWLRRSTPDEDEFWVPITELPFTIGRTSRNNLRLRYPHISRSHAVIEQVDDELCIRDQGSFNGTFVNGTQVDSAPLSDGDRIKVGNIQLTFQVLVEASALSV